MDWALNSYGANREIMFKGVDTSVHVNRLCASKTGSILLFLAGEALLRPFFTPVGVK